MSHAAYLRFLESRNLAHFEEFMLSTRGKFFSTARRVCGDRELARDVTQDAYARLLVAPIQTNHVRDFDAFVATYVINVARTRLRGEARRRERETYVAQVRLERKSSLTREEALDLEIALGELPRELLQVIELRYYGNLQVKAVASELGVTTRTVSKRLRSAEGILRAKLAVGVAALVLPALRGRGEAAPGSSAAATGGLAASIAAWARSLVPATPRIATLAASGAAAVMAIVALTLGGPRLWSPRPATPVTAPAAVVMGDTSARAPVSQGPAKIPSGAAPFAPAREPGSPARKSRRATVAQTGDAKTVMPAPASLSLHVVDEAGKPVSTGEVTFECRPVDRFQGLIRRIARRLGFRTDMPSRVLAGASPLELEIPPGLHGIRVAVTVSSPGFVAHRFSAFTARPGHAGELTVTLDPAAELSLVLLDARTGEPVSGAHVDLLEMSGPPPRSISEILKHPVATKRTGGRSNAEGELVFKDVQARKLYLEVTAEGYWRVHAAEVQPLEPVTVWLHPYDTSAGKGTLTVKILEPDGKPWPHCAWMLDNAYRDDQLLHTDASGVCRIEKISAGPHTVGLHHPPIEVTDESIALAQKLLGYPTEIIEVAAGDETQVTLAAEDRTGRVRVQLVNEAGRTCPGVSLRVSAARSDPVTTDKLGAAVFVGLRTGRHDIYAAARGAEVKLGEVDLASGSETRARFTYGSQVLRGQVIDENGRAVENALLKCKAPREIEASPDEKGRFEISGLEPGTYDLEIVSSEDSLVPAKVSAVVAAGLEPGLLGITLRKGGTVMFLAATSSGGPAHEDLKIDRIGTGGRREYLLPAHRGQRESERRTVHPLEPGEHEFVLEVPGQSPMELHAQVEAGKETVVRVVVGDTAESGTH